MRPLPALVTILLVCACSKADRSADSAAGAVSATPPAPAPMPAPATPVSLASLAGKWTLVATPTEGRDTTPTTITLDARGDTATWTQTFAGQKPVPIHVRAEGDSIVTHSGPYDSFRRKGVKVTTDGVWRVKDGKIVGTTTARYSVKTADSVLHLRMEGTKQP